ncbi:YhfX family PLP-dependent enzyme [Clostridium sp. C8]|uniref:YhfX family PLP-dependent enzyme n=1 Tax=Clostridium sp. C8 TaxID=1667357 RepID=UPI00062E6A40|nr:YhfX family PLP-dependent enzyme [Clostridium sp. C8]KLE14658.1 amino acid racemase [Clostridium sp. C8]
MFLEKTINRNRKLVQAAFKLHKEGLIMPDTYLIDLDTLIENAKKIKEEADKYGIKLYFMSKQIGRNPLVCKEFMKLGYDGAVVVDFKEAEVMIDNNIKIGHVGHLVQIPKTLIEKVIKSRPDYITVYSIEKAKELNEVCSKLGLKQNIMLRVLDENDNLYSGQYGGFKLNELKSIGEELTKLKSLNLSGVTSFPCFLFNEESNEIKRTNNIDTIKKAKEILEKEFNIKINQLNMPSATCVNSIEKIYREGGTHGEPGHGLTGSTPYHKFNDGDELPAMVYVSEVSHNLQDKAYCYGGGHYRRSHMENALVGQDLENSKIIEVIPPTDESIDYHFELSENCKVSDTVVMAFRTQIFVTRSNVAIVKGIKSGNPEIVGIYDSQGRAVN